MIKKIMPMILSVIAMLTLQFMPLSEALAGVCSFYNSSAINITINDQIQLTPSTSVPSAAVVLYSRSFATGSISYTCNGSVQWQSVYTRAYTSASQNYIYNTEIPGIGIRIKWPESFSDNYYVPSKSVACLTVCTISYDNIKIEFIHTGLVTAGEKTIPAGEIARAYFLNDNGALQLMSVSLAADVIITPRTCAIYPSSNHINLGTYDKASLSSRGVGSAVDFSFHISCPVPTTIGLMFESVNTAFSPEPGEIGTSAGSVPGLSVKASISTISASLYSTLNLNSSYPIRNVMERTVPMRAQLFVKDSSIFESQGGAGTVNSSLLYTMSIQ